MINTLDPWREELPAFDGETLNAKYAVVEQTDPTPAQVEAWAEVTRWVDRLKAADRLLIATPM